jgi:hypothetical protein
MALYSFKDGKTYKDGVEVSLATPKPTTGLGDVVAGAAKAVGVTPSPGCGCEKRRQAMNRATPKLVGRVLDALRDYWSKW